MKKLGHISKNVQCELKQLIHEREGVSADVPSKTNGTYHDVDVADQEVIKHHPYLAYRANSLNTY